MKLLKKGLSLLLAAVMVMALGVSAFAEDAAAGYTISTKTGDTHTYSVYQILTGDLSEGVLSNIKAGSNFKTANGKGADGANQTAAEAAAAIQALTVEGQDLADAIAEYVNFESTVYGTVSSSASLTGVPAGYYLIKDNGAASGTTDSYSTYIVKVVNNVTIEPKKSTPTFEKKVQDINDSTDTSVGTLQDSADYDIGDDVPFTLTGTVASNYADYDHYYFEFSDQMEKSLTFNKDSVKVTVDGAVIDSGYTVSNGTTIASEDNYNGGTAFSVVFTDLKTITSVHAGSKIVVTYTANLNKDAVLGEQGNVNEAKLIYSNNPNNSGDGSKKPDDTGETPWDNVIVFTYKVVVDKVDSADKALAGAAFKLEKEIKATTEGGENTWTTINEFTAGDATSFTFSGLDDGNYRLTETKTPAGYNTIDPITFTVTATHGIEWTTGARTDVLTDLSGDKTSGSATFTASKSEGSLTTKVVNNKGNELPSTGGMGTTLFYVFGSVLVLGAAVVLITRKRMKNA